MSIINLAEKGAIAYFALSNPDSSIPIKACQSLGLSYLLAIDNLPDVRDQVPTGKQKLTELCLRTIGDIAVTLAPAILASFLSPESTPSFLDTAVLVIAATRLAQATLKRHNITSYLHQEPVNDISISSYVSDPKIPYDDFGKYQQQLHKASRNLPPTPRHGTPKKLNPYHNSQYLSPEALNILNSRNE